MLILGQTKGYSHSIVTGTVAETMLRLMASREHQISPLPTCFEQGKVNLHFAKLQDGVGDNIR